MLQALQQTQPSIDPKYSYSLFGFLTLVSFRTRRYCAPRGPARQCYARVRCSTLGKVTSCWQSPLKHYRCTMSPMPIVLSKLCFGQCRC